MHRFTSIAALALVALCGEVGSAQTSTPITFQPSLYAGVALPTGDNSNFLNSGFTIGGGLDLHTMTAPLSWRAEVSYTRFGVQDNGFGVNEHLSDVSGRANAVLSVPGMGLSPYLIGGIGAYNVTDTQSDPQFGNTSTSETDFGWNIGAGIDFPIGEIAGRLEVRYHSINMGGGNLTYVPITFGIRF
jgi:opacity protein-like surface antigen